MYQGRYKARLKLELITYTTWKGLVSYSSFEKKNTLQEYMRVILRDQSTQDTCRARVNTCIISIKQPGRNPIAKFLITPKGSLRFYQ